MKQLSYITYILAVVVSMFTTSCLDDSMVDIEVEDFAGSPYIVDFNETPNSGGYISRDFQGTTDESVKETSEFRINLSSPNKLDHDLEVTVELDLASANSFIDENSSFKALPAEKYDFSSVTVTIPAGEREAVFDVEFSPSGLSADDKYIVAFSITGTSDPDVLISGNYGTHYVKIGVTNIFHGSYTLDGSWYYAGGTGYLDSGDTDDALMSTGSSTTIYTDYIYTGWGYTYIIEVDLENPQTIEGHDNAYKFTVVVEGKEDVCEQHDDYDGEVWNYCYQDDSGKWHFKLCQTYTSSSGAHFSQALYTQN